MNKLPYKYRTKLFFNHIIICVSLLLKLFMKYYNYVQNNCINSIILKEKSYLKKK